MNNIAVHINFAINVAFIRAAVRKNTKAKAKKFTIDNWILRKHCQPRIHRNRTQKLNFIPYRPILKPYNNYHIVPLLIPAAIISSTLNDPN